MKSRSLVLIVLFLIALAVPARADHHQAKIADPANPVGQVAVGIGSFIATAIYSPVKTAWAVFALTVLGPVNLGIQRFDVNLTSRQTRCLVGGDWTVTTDHLMGREQLDFVGCQ